MHARKGKATLFHEPAGQAVWHLDASSRQLPEYMPFVSMFATSHGPTGARTSTAMAEATNI